MNNLAKLFEEVLIDLIDNKKEFTAYDVTDEVRSMVDEKVYHYQWKEFVHNVINAIVPPSYSRRVDMSKNGAWLYYSDKSDDNFVVDLKPIKLPPFIMPKLNDLHKSINNFNNLTNKVKDNIIVSNRKVKKNDAVLYPTSRQRVLIPAKIIRKIEQDVSEAPHVYTLIFFNIYAQKIVLFNINRANADTNSYGIDKYNNIRLSAKVLKKAGLLGKPLQYKIDEVNKTCTLTEYKNKK